MSNPSEVDKTVKLACNFLLLSFRASYGENLDARDSDLIFAQKFIFEKLQEFDRKRLSQHPNPNGTSSDVQLEKILENLRSLEWAIVETLSAGKEKRGQMLGRLLKIAQFVESESNEIKVKTGNLFSGSMIMPRRKEPRAYEHETMARLVTNRVK